MAKKLEEFVFDFSINGLNDIAKLQREVDKTKISLDKLNKTIKKQKGSDAAQSQEKVKLSTKYKALNKQLNNHIKLLGEERTGIAKKKREEKALLALKKSMEKQAKKEKAIAKRRLQQLKKEARQREKLKKTVKGNTEALLKKGLVIAAARKGYQMLKQVLTESIRAFADFEKGIKNVKTLLSDDDKSMFGERLWKGSLDVIKNYGFAVGDVNKAMFDTVSAGVKASEAVDFMNTASKLAIAGVTNLKSSVTGLATIMNAYRMDSKDANRIAEILFATQKRGVTTVEELSKAMGVVVPFAAASGISFEELGAAMAVTTRSGLDAAKTVTALRAAISQMQNPAEESRDLFIQYGIPIGSLQMKAVGFTETMKRLNIAFKENPKFVEDMFGNVRGLTAILSIAGDNIDEYNRFLKENQEDTGTASSLNKAFAENLDSTSIALDKMDAAVIALKTSIGSSDWMREFVEETTELVNVLDADSLSFWEKIWGLTASFTGGGMMGIDVQEMLLNKDKVEANKKAALEAEKDLKENQEKLREIAMKGAKDVDSLTMGEWDIIDSVLSLGDVAEYSDYLNWFYKEFKSFDDKMTKLETERKDKKDRDDKEKGEAQIRYNKLERDSRLSMQEDIAKINNEALKSGETAAETEIKIIARKRKHWEALRDSADASVNDRRNAIVELGKLDNQELKNDLAIAKYREQTILALKTQAAQEAFNVINQLNSRANENRINEIKSEEDALREKLNNGIISQRQFDKKKEELDKKSFQQRKKNELKMAAISFAQQLINIQLNAAANPNNAVTFGLAGLTQAGYLTALAAATFAANVGMISSQKFARGGMVHGKSHAQGGEKFSVGGRVVELEGGEAVINKRSTSMFGNMLSAMNVAGGGKSFTSPNLGGASLINYEALGRAVAQNTHVVLPVETLNKTQNRVKAIESSSRF